MPDGNPRKLTHHAHPSQGVGAPVPTTSKGNSLTVHEGKVAGKDAGFDTLCLHAGYGPDGTTSRGVPLYRTSPYVFKSTKHAANLFGLAELGNIYSRLGNPTVAILEQRIAMLEGAHSLGALGVASGTTAVFYSIINIASVRSPFPAYNRLPGCYAPRSAH